jgi:D-arginine dehydrogenase
VIYDIAIIGAGIAGASLAAALAPHRSVLLVEAEDQPGYHTTGRSAAFWHETLGGPFVQPLTTASRAFLQDGGFLTPRLNLNVADEANLPLLDELIAEFAGTGVNLTRLDAQGVKRLVPLANDTIAGGVVEGDCSDIDVAALHQHYLGAFKRAGGTLETRFRVATMERTEDVWTIGDGSRSVVARIVVNAAGAWADTVAAVAGAKPVGIQPMRRTIAQVRVSGGDVPTDLPLVIDIAGTFYFRPEGEGRLWLCPHDETPVEPCDAAPEELDVAIAIDRFETVTDWRVAAVERKWAGLRSFAPDRLPVFGFDPGAPGFFWCAGQGGVGIQTSPAAAALCAHLLLGGPADPMIAHIDAGRYSPARFISA